MPHYLFKSIINRCLAMLLLVLLANESPAQQAVKGVEIIPVDSGWANNSINAVVFRKNSLVTFRDTQFIAFYDPTSHVVLGKRRLGSTNWILQKTEHKGNTSDAHNSISIMVDGAGYLHVAWDHHNNALRYMRSISPGSLQMISKMPMTGKLEGRVSYPEFFKLPNGNLLFFYRDGGSGQGNLVINQYNVVTQQWEQLHSNLVDGQKKRNAYWQACVDGAGTIHVSWVWRESPDVASNHDMAYARSVDGGKTWERSTGEKYVLPITAATAEYALRIPQKSELINQTSMTTDDKGNPFIASYWKDSGSMVPQYHIIFHNGKQWRTATIPIRKTSFSLSGVGSKRIPISRPQVMVKGKGDKASVLLVFRDEERGSKVSVATNKKMRRNRWKVYDLTNRSVGSWEPSFDTELWREKQQLHLFVQYVEQVDGEGKAAISPQMVEVLEWKPKY
ncbi:BNR repeat-containing protein [Aridibaculum aurantiacum]|uniref:BNR repeat-containing protein n=1 Tax=Aridibaculum aurantiacum TaxID=2810307 RepID=UPI001A96E8AF|nr:BNR repeat-containing protein [Aridibaculum aurantiacum]